MSVALPMTKKEKEAMVVPIWGVKVRERGIKCYLIENQIKTANLQGELLTVYNFAV